VNLKEAKKLKPGAIVRESWLPASGPQWHGIVLSKVHVEERHMASMLGVMKDERYDVVVHWLLSPRAHNGSEPQKKIREHQNWEIMVVSHVK
jgi:cell division inhibitor SulA